MAAFDTFDQLTDSLSKHDRDSLKELIREQLNELLAARSEDARIRLVSRFTEEIRERLRQQKK